MLIGNLIDRARHLMAKDKPTAPHDETAWSESTIYSKSSFPKYNPDDLLTRKGYGIYRKMMTDEQVKAVVRFKRDAITSRDWHFECNHEGLTDEEQIDRIGFFTAALANVRGSWLDCMNGVMSAMYHGFSMSEKLYEPMDREGGPMIGVKALKLRPFDTFYFHVDAHGNVERVAQKYEGSEQDIDINRFVHYVQSPDYDEHYGSSELRECYRAWFSKDITIRMLNIYLERMAGGFIHVSPKDGKLLVEGSREYSALQSALTNISAKTAMILPSGLEVKVEHPSTTDAYERAIIIHDKAIAKALLVPNLMGISEQGSTGSFAQSQTQLEAFLWTLDADATRLEEVLNEQLFRELGDINYGDGLYPSFRFKPVSDAKKMEVVTKWKELVQAGAVQVTETDEAHMRSLLDIPAKPEVAEEAAPEIALNGAQIASVIEVASRVGRGELSRDAAAAILTIALPITEEQARRMVTTEVKQEPVLPVPGQPGPQSQPAALPPDAGGQAPDEEDAGEETIVGKGVLKSAVCGHHHGPLLSTVEAFSRAMKRVDFAVIGSKSEDAADQSSYEVASINGDAVARLVGEAEGIGYDVDKIAELKYTSAELAAMKKAVIAGLNEGAKIGAQHAVKELRKAGRGKFARADFADDRAFEDKELLDFVKQRAHQITGNISQATQAKIQNTLMEGVKGSHAFADVKKQIYKDLESEGLLTEEDIEEALGTVTVKDTKARISTIMRTTTFEAINEARYAYFSDPALEGFVEALEYSAILDDRTTEICSQLDGKTFAVGSEEWETFNPPNHYNCRSLLIPVIAGDAWQQDDPPTVDPQKGFGFDRTGGAK